MKTMMFHIERQPEVGEQVLQQEELAFDQTAAIFSAKPKRVLAVATGSSMNATEMARPWFEAVTGLPLDAVEPATLVDYGARPGDYDLVIAVSQRGTSSSTVAAVTSARQRYGCPIIAVTGHPENPLAELVDAVVDIQCGPEDVPFSTVGVTSTVVTLMLLAVRLAEALGEARGPGRQAIQDTVSAMQTAIQASKRYVAERTSALSEVHRWFLLGYGPALGAAIEGELKLVETVRIPCSAHETESFMHGPIFELGDSHGVWFTHTAGPGAERSAQLREFVGRYARTVVGSTQGPAGDPALLLLPDSHPLTASLLHLIPLQILAAALSESHGVDLTVPAFPDFRSALKTKLRWDN